MKIAPARVGARKEVSMGKKIVIGGVLVFIAWAVLDFVIHVLILGGTYAQQPELWRPQAEMKMGVMYVAVLIAALAFAALWGWFVSDRTPVNGAKFGLVWGIGMGVSMGYGTYAVMPIPYHMALVWFLGTVVEAVVAGLIVGAVVRD